MQRHIINYGEDPSLAQTRNQRCSFVQIRREQVEDVVICGVVLRRDGFVSEYPSPGSGTKP